MISTTFNGETVFVLTEAPNWDRGVTLRAEVPVVAEAGLTGAEMRTPLAQALQVRIAWQSTLTRTEFNTLRNALVNQDDARVLCPAWPLTVPGADWSDETHPGGGIWIGWSDDWSSYALGAASSFDPADWDWFAPALLGRIEIEPGQIHRDDAVTVEFSFREDGVSDYALSMPDQTWTAGPALNDGTVPDLFPFAVNWSTEPRGALPEVQVTRKTFGRSRLLASAFYPQHAAVSTQGMVTVATVEDTARLLRWWVDCQGSTKPHYLHTHAGTSRLAADALAGTTTLTLSEPTLLGSHRYLALQTPLVLECVRVQSLTGAAAALLAPLAYSWAAADAVVAWAGLMRHSGPEIELKFTAPGLGDTQLAWRELVEEYVPMAGEVRGESVGAGTTLTWLYQFTVDVCGTQTVYRYTSFERDVLADGHTWTAAPVQHSEIRSSIEMSRDEVTLEGRLLEPLMEFLPGRLTGRVLLEIHEAQIPTGE